MINSHKGSSLHARIKIKSLEKFFQPENGSQQMPDTQPPDGQARECDYVVSQ